MAGMMKGSKGMGAARMKGKEAKPKGAKTPPAKSPPPGTAKATAHKGPHKSPRSAHIREAEGGYILSKHGGDSDNGGMGSDHVAPDFETAMALCRDHLGAGGPEGPSAVDEAEAPAAGGMMVNKASHSE